MWSVCRFVVIRVKMECNDTRAESRFGLPAKRTSPFMLMVVFMLDSDYSPSSVTTNNINGLVRFAGRPNLLSAHVPLHSVFTIRVKNKHPVDLDINPRPPGREAGILNCRLRLQICNNVHYSREQIRRQQEAKIFLS